MSTFEASVKQQVNEKEAIQFTQYPQRQTVRNKWSESDKLCVLLSYLLPVSATFFRSTRLERSILHGSFAFA